jgi:hypothetical protein
MEVHFSGARSCRWIVERGVTIDRGRAGGLNQCCDERAMEGSFIWYECLSTPRASPDRVPAQSVAGGGRRRRDVRVDETRSERLVRRSRILGSWIAELRTE